MKEIIDLSSEQNSFVRVLETQDGRRTYIRDYNDNMRVPSEAEITAAIRKMVETPPVVAFIKGHDERKVSLPGDRDYSSFAVENSSRMALVNQGFDVVELDMSACETIPEQINILIFAEMRQALTEHESKVLDEYLARGGNLFILTDVGRQEATNPLLARFGLKMEHGVLAQPVGDFNPDLVLSRVSKKATSLARFHQKFSHYSYRVSMPGCVALSTLEETNGFTLTPLLETKEKGAWIELEAKNLKEDEVVCNPKAGEKEQVYITAFAAERKVGDKTQRIIVCGDADCLSNAEMYMQRDGYRPGNSELVAEGFHWLTDGKFPVDVTKIEPIDTRYSVTVDQFNTIKYVFTIFIPGLLLLLGAGLWIKRHKK
jgi:ABC-2 type transport system permease protein